MFVVRTIIIIIIIIIGGSDSHTKTMCLIFARDITPICGNRYQLLIAKYLARDKGEIKSILSM